MKKYLKQIFSDKLKYWLIVIAGFILFILCSTFLNNTKLSGYIERPYVDEDDITLLNPGSISFPRQEGHRPSYLIMTIDDETQKASYEIKYL